MMTLTARLAIPALAASLLLALGFAAGSAEKAPGTKAGPKLAHMVFFTLKDRSPESRDRFVASCHKYLSNQEGAESFSVGTIAEDVVEPVSVRDFDVALHVVFESKEAKENYLKNARHSQFVEENKEHFAKVRVFDSYLTTP